MCIRDRHSTLVPAFHENHETYDSHRNSFALINGKTAKTYSKHVQSFQSESRSKNSNQKPHQFVRNFVENNASETASCSVSSNFVTHKSRQPSLVRIE